MKPFAIPVWDFAIDKTRLVCAATKPRPSPERLEANKQLILIRAGNTGPAWEVRGMEEKRLGTLSTALVADHLEGLLRQFPGDHGALLAALQTAPGSLLHYTPDNVRTKVEALAGVLGLSTAEALALVARTPLLLGRNADVLRERVDALAELIGRDLAVGAVTKQPGLLEQSTETLLWKLNVIRTAAARHAKWAKELESGMTATKYSAMLHAGVKPLLRLKYTVDEGRIAPDTAGMRHVICYTAEQWRKHAPDFDDWVARLPERELPLQGGVQAASAVLARSVARPRAAAPPGAAPNSSSGRRPKPAAAAEAEPGASQDTSDQNVDVKDERYAANKQVIMEAMEKAGASDVLPLQHRATEVRGLCHLTPQLVGRRLEGLLALFPPEHRPAVLRAVARAPGSVLGVSPESVAAKLDALGAALGVPRLQALGLVADAPRLLGRRPDSLAERVAALAGLIGPELAVGAVCREPGLLEQSTETLAWKLGAIRAAAARHDAWAQELAGRMTATKYSFMLHAGVRPVLRLKYLADKGLITPDTRTMGGIIRTTEAQWAKLAPDFGEWVAQLPAGEVPQQRQQAAPAAAQQA